MAQTAIVRAQIERILPGLLCEVVAIRTTGDQLTTASLAAVGGKGLFVRELEQALADGRVDVAVHSMKDMPARLAAGFRLIAVPAREDTADVVLTSGPDLHDLPRGARLGTSSLRRRFQALRLRGDFNVLPLRGNVDTRIAKLRAGEFDAIILAAAGLLRLGVSDLPPMQRLAEDEFVPAGGQGALAIEAANGAVAGSQEIEQAIAALEHPPSRLEVGAEREFLAGVGASCASPIGVRAVAAGSRLTIRALLFSLDGARSMADWLDFECRSMADAERAGVELAQRMLRHGASELMAT